MIRLILPNLALAIILTGCGPRNLEDCLKGASGKPTEMGVRMAAAICHKEFPAKPVEQR